jgi:hypothetical protein
MTIAAQNIIKDAQIILQDVAGRRWSVSELVGWLNAGLRELTMRSPMSTSKTVQLQLVAGTQQVLPDEYASILRVLRNVKPFGVGFKGGASITAVSRELMDLQVPDWHNPDRTRAKSVVRHIIDDPTEPQSFYVYPLHDGTGWIECMVARVIPPVAPDQANGNKDSLTNYTALIPLNAIYQSALLDYLLYRAFSKDGDGGSAERAAAHLALFNAVVDRKLATDLAMNVHNPTQSPT